MNEPLLQNETAAPVFGRPANWAINGRFLTQPVTGVQRYAREITKAIDAALVTDRAIAQKIALRLIVPADCTVVPDYQAIAVTRSAIGRGHPWEQLVLPVLAGRDGLINLANLAPIARRRQIVCLHDANVFLEPESYTPSFRRAYRAVFPRIARRAAAVTTVSRFSQAMLQKFAITPHPATIIGNGHEHALAWNAANSRFNAPNAFTRPFVFALGSRAKHKQIERLVALAPELGALGVDLVISGASASVFAKAGPAEGANVKTLGFVTDDDLAALFRHALCFAFPSRTEGFGLPLLEAMVHGCPIVASDRASMPEVCGDAALYAAPEDGRLWLAHIKSLLDEPWRRDSLRDKGLERYPLFSWSQGAEAYLALALRLSARR